MGDKIQKPFLKWVGGKTQIMDKIISKFPKKINNYHEPFLGGGSVLFALLSYMRQNKIKVNGKIYAYDVNPILINVYKHIQESPEQLHEYIDMYWTLYDKIDGNVVNRIPKDIDEARTSKESLYYWLRDKFNKMNKETMEASALFIFINKTCFRGMYREGPNGFNVPYGHYKKTPAMLSLEEILYISDFIKDVEFISQGFDVSLTNIQEGDFVYMDPPYAPENDKSFVGYVADGFTYEMHEKLFESILKLDENNVKFVMSNSNVTLVKEFFSNFTNEHVKARRAINAKNPESVTTELIIYNFTD